MPGISKEIALPFQIKGINKNPDSKKMNPGYSARAVLNRRSAIDTFNSSTRTFTEIKRNAVSEDTLFAIPAAAPE
jgi:hypothetical protein